MNSLLIAFAGEKTRQHVSQLFADTEFSVDAVCGTGAEILSVATKGFQGVVLCGASLYDMSGEDLAECLPKGAGVVLLAPQEELEDLDCQKALKVAAPVTGEVLLEAVRQAGKMARERTAVPQRSAEDKELIAKAKLLLMEQKGLTEEDAYRLIQRTSMNNGAKMVHTAQSILEGSICI